MSKGHVVSKRVPRQEVRDPQHDLHFSLISSQNEERKEATMVRFVGSTLLFLIPSALAELEYGDRFTYDATEQRSDGFTDYGPNQWSQIECDERTPQGLDECLAYRDKWHTGQDWEIERNYCRWCPESSPGNCGRHHQSPINLERNRGLGFWENDGNRGDNSHSDAKECIDVHWMKVRK